MTVKHDATLGGYTVYKHTSPSGKVYIGITRDKLQRRWRGGHGYKNNAHFFRAIQKYGWTAFLHEVLFTGLTEAQAIEKERELIAAYDSTNPTKGYNLDPGGGVRSQETAAKISAALTGVPFSEERRKALSTQRRGRLLSETHKQKISASHKSNPVVLDHISALNSARAGKPKSTTHRMKLSEAQPRRRKVKNLDTGEIFNCVREAAQSCGGQHPNIVKACTGEREKAYGYHWAYEEVSA